MDGALEKEVNLKENKDVSVTVQRRWSGVDENQAQIPDQNEVGHPQLLSTSRISLI